MTEPLRFSFVVECPADHAFSTWAERASAWWPPSHTVTGKRGVEVVFEPRAGGRIFERAPDGTEVEWGEIRAWEPPGRLAYSWFIRTDRESATDVEIRFLDQDDGTTRVEIEHGGWDRLGDRGPRWRDVNFGGWDGVLPVYVEACRLG